MKRRAARHIAPESGIAIRPREGIDPPVVGGLDADRTGDLAG
jgi:hypothetical protein